MQLDHRKEKTSLHFYGYFTYIPNSVFKADLIILFCPRSNLFKVPVAVNVTTIQTEIQARNMVTNLDASSPSSPTCNHQILQSYLLSLSKTSTALHLFSVPSLAMSPHLGSLTANLLTCVSFFALVLSSIFFTVHTVIFSKRKLE